MANVFKTFKSGDIATSRTLLHEAIPITGSLISGAYIPENQIKNYSHGMWQSVYDYPYLSSSANHIFDISVGYSANTSYTTGSDPDAAKKRNIYGTMAQVLVGNDITGSILEFDDDGDIAAGGTKATECYFINFARLLYKDEIKKGSFQLKFGTGTYGTPCTAMTTITDTNAQTEYRVNSPAGEYGILYDGSGNKYGLLFYQAGVAVLGLTGSIKTAVADGVDHFDDLMVSASITASCDALRHRLCNIQFNNTTELNSTIYFARKGFNEFNYSSNPTYLSESKIRVKNVSTDAPVAYATGVGLFSADNELLAVAKLSESLKNTSSDEYILRIRLDW